MGLVCQSVNYYKTIIYLVSRIAIKTDMVFTITALTV